MNDNEVMELMAEIFVESFHDTISDIGLEELRERINRLSEKRKLLKEINCKYSKLRLAESLK
jgi:hypothetical protein